MPNPSSRVLHLIDHMGSGGAQRVVLDLIEAGGTAVALAVGSLRSHCLAAAANRLVATDTPYFGLGLTRRRPLAIHRVRSLYRDWRPDVVHSHLEVSNTVAVVAGAMLGRDRPLMVNHQHNDPFQQLSVLHRMAGWLLAPRFEAHIVPSQTVAGAVQKAFGGRCHRLTVIPYGIDREWLDRGTTDRTVLLRGGARHVVGTVGRLVPQKSTRTLVEATPRLLAREPSTRVLIVGDGPLRSQLEALTRELGVAHAVDFLGYSDDLQSIYSALDVFVLPSKYEGFPISLLEVMAMGTPIVATRVTGITDVVSDGRSGLLVPFDDPEALGAAIWRVLSNDHLRGAMREEARQLVRREHTRDIAAARVEALYAELLEGRNRPISRGLSG